MKGLFSEESKSSSTRLSMLLAVISGCAVAIIGVWKGESDLIGLSTLSAGLVSAGMGFKVWQKGKEKEDGK